MPSLAPDACRACAASACAHHHSPRARLRWRRAARPFRCGRTPADRPPGLRRHRKGRCSLGAAPAGFADIGARALPRSVVRPLDDFRALPQRGAADLLHRRRRLSPRDVPTERRDRKFGTGFLLDQVDDLIGGQSMWVGHLARALPVHRPSTMRRVVRLQPGGRPGRPTAIRRQAVRNFPRNDPTTACCNAHARVRGPVSVHTTGSHSWDRCFRRRYRGVWPGIGGVTPGHRGCSGNKIGGMFTRTPISLMTARDDYVAGSGGSGTARFPRLPDLPDEEMAGISRPKSRPTAPPHDCGLDAERVRTPVGIIEWIVPAIFAALPSMSSRVRRRLISDPGSQPRLLRPARHTRVVALDVR